MRTPRTAIALALVAPLLVGLAACAGADEPQTAPTTTPTVPAIQPSEEPSISPVSFNQPALCAELLPAARIAAFEQSGYILLGGPEGKFGNEYLADSTPEQAVGGITCFWGDESTEVSAITVSVAPLGSSTRAQVVAQLTREGLNEGAIDGATTFARFGDTSGAPAIYNVLRNDSWISVISSRGGEESYLAAVTIAEEAAATVYK